MVERFAASALLDFTRDAYLACGLTSADAAIASDAMIEADLTGFDTHGIFRLASYCKTLREGRVNPTPNISVTNRAAATALVDGDNGMGHLVMTYAANLAVELARAAGIGWVGVRRSNHAGAAGVYAAMPLAHGMAGIYGAVSTANHMAPWGGAEALLGTNPIAVAIPAGDASPVVLDIATSISSFGTIRKHQLLGQPLPDGWVVHSETGAPINDAKRTGEGVLLPIGEHKGSGLALIIGLLAGVLNGAAFGRDVVDFNAPGTAETNTGQFIVAIDVKRFRPLDAFKADMDRHLGDLAASPTLPGVDAVHLPGAGRQKRRDERSAQGVPLAPELVKQLDALAATLKITPLGGRV